MTTTSTSTRIDLPVIEISEAWHHRALRVMTPTTQVLAKGPTQYVDGVAPKFAQRGKGARLWDVDGNEFLDYSMGVGPVLLGYSHGEVDDAVRAQLERGMTFSLVDTLEVEVSETLTRLVPCAEAVRFGKTGAEATSAAIRVARAFTGRDRVLACGYHGWHDWYIGTLPRDAGVPGAVKELTSTFAYNDIDSLEQSIDDSVACVILEPMTFDFPRPGYLDAVVDIAHRHGALVVFDEIWTGFRWAVGGAQEAFDVTPDLATLSKGIANGMPLSALVGRRDVMEVLVDDAFFFSTFGGEALSLAAARATMEIVERDAIPEWLAVLGESLKRGYNDLARTHGLGDVTECLGHPARTLVTFTPEGCDALLAKSIVQQELIRKGILWQGFHTLSASHRHSDVTRTLEAYDHALGVLARALSSGNPQAMLLGEPVQPVFRRTGDFDTKPKSRR